MKPEASFQPSAIRNAPEGILPAQEFFTEATDDYCIAPNLEPHPPLAAFQQAIKHMEQADDGTSVWCEIADVEDGVPICNALLIITSRPLESFTEFAAQFGADGVVRAGRRVRKQIQNLGRGNVWRIPWD